MPQRRKKKNHSSTLRDMSRRDQIPEAAAKPRHRRHIYIAQVLFKARPITLAKTASESVNSFSRYQLNPSVKKPRRRRKAEAP